MKKERRFKIFQTNKGFAVWQLKNYGNGSAYADTGRRFETREAAQKYIDAAAARGNEN